MSNILTDLSPTTLATASGASLRAFIRRLAEATVVETADIGVGFRFFSHVPHLWFRGVIASAAPDDGADRAIVDTLAYFRERGVDAISWWFDREPDRAAWAPLLEAHGFRHSDDTPAMARPLTELPPIPGHPLEVRPVVGEEELAAWVRVFVPGYGLPDTFLAPMHALFADLGVDATLRHYLGTLEGEPVASATLLLDAGVAGIYNVATLEAARGRGIGSVMTLSPLHEARREGYAAAVLQSSELGYGLYRRLGFEELGRVGYDYWRAPST